HGALTSGQFVAHGHLRAAAATDRPRGFLSTRRGAGRGSSGSRGWRCALSARRAEREAMRCRPEETLRCRSASWVSGIARTATLKPFQVYKKQHEISLSINIKATCYYHLTPHLTDLIIARDPSVSIGLFWNTPNSLCDKGLWLIPERLVSSLLLTP